MVKLQTPAGFLPRVPFRCTSTARDLPAIVVRVDLYKKTAP